MVRRVLKSKVIRYGISAGIATVVDVTVYFITFNFILKKHDIPLIDPFKLTAPIASLAVSYSFGLMTNFMISKYMVFTESDLRGRHQLIRYLLVAVFILFLNYLMMKFLIYILEWYPTPSRIVSAVSIGIISFTFHKFYSFKVTRK